MIDRTEALAEPVERRTLAARNSEQPAVTATQSAGETLLGLARVREAAKRDKTLRFNNLLHHLTPALLCQAYYALKKNAASGVDKISWRAYGEKGLNEPLWALHQQVQSGRYRPAPLKGSGLKKKTQRNAR